MILDLIVQIHNMQNIQKLSLVLVQTFNLYIEDGMRVNIDTIMLFDVFSQTQFILVLDVHEFLLCFRVIHIQSQFFDLRKICDPLVTDMICDPVSQQRISVFQETSLGDTVGLVVEFLRHHLIEIFKLLFFQDLGMQTGNTVYGVTAYDSQMSHLYLAVIDNGHLGDLVLITRISALDLQKESSVDLFHDLIDTGKQTGEQLDGPFFQCLSHDCMVCICTGTGGKIPCILPLQPFLIYEDTHQLSYSYCRMSIVHLESNFVRQVMNVTVFFFKFLDGSLYAGGDKEVLLFQTQFFTCIMVIVGIQYLYDILSQILLLNGFSVLTLIKGAQFEIIHSLSIPDTKSIYHMIVVTNDGHIVRNSHNRLISLLDITVSSGIVVIFYANIAAEFYLFSIFRTTQFERVAVL